MFQDVTIVIPTQGRPTKLAKCITSLARQELPIGTNLELIVAIDGGEAFEFDIPRDAPSNTRIIRLPRVGAAAARNAAIDQATGELLIFSNDDTYPRRDWVREHLVGQERRASPGMLLGETHWMTWPNPTVFDGLLRDTSMVFFYDQMRDGESYGFRHFWTCNASVPKEMAQAVGGFDDRIRPVFFEDCEFAYRIEERFGDGVFYHSSAVNVHDHRLTWEDYCSRERMLGRMALRLANANVACFEAIYGRSDFQAMAADFSQWLKMDNGDHARADRAIQSWLVRPLDEIKNWQAVRELLVASHLPLKRRLFREGYLEEFETGIVGTKPVGNLNAAITVAQ